jgi:hypothetical protein
MTLDYDTNKRLLDEVAQVPSKRVRNKIAGFATVCEVALQFFDDPNLSVLVRCFGSRGPSCTLKNASQSRKFEKSGNALMHAFVALML